jgi:hypothetical protein
MLCTRNYCIQHQLHILCGLSLNIREKFEKINLFSDYVNILMKTFPFSKVFLPVGGGGDEQFSPIWDSHSDR